MTKKDLSGLDLRSEHFTDKDLRGANLSNSDCTNVEFVDADLTRANLSGAKLIGTDFTGAKLIEACLDNADLHAAILTEADLFGASLVGANLLETYFCEASLFDADLTGTTGLLDPKEFMSRRFQKTEQGYIIYTVVEDEMLKPGEYIERVVNRIPVCLLGCGIQFSTEKYFASRKFKGNLWKALIHWEDMINVIVPYNIIIGVARCARLQLLEIVNSEEIK